MKNTFTAIILMISMTATAQTIKVSTKAKTPNVTISADGNFKEITDLPTGKTYTDAKGIVSKVFSTPSGKPYVITGISEKTGKPKKKYLIVKI